MPGSTCGSVICWCSTIPGCSYSTSSTASRRHGAQIAVGRNTETGLRRRAFGPDDLNLFVELSRQLVCGEAENQTRDLASTERPDVRCTADDPVWSCNETVDQDDRRGIAGRPCSEVWVRQQHRSDEAVANLTRPPQVWASERPYTVTELMDGLGVSGASEQLSVRLVGAHHRL